VDTWISDPHLRLGVAHLYRRWAKRYLDTGVALIVLVAFSPIFAVVALSIWLDDGAPILFRQTRVGMHGKTFQFLKFRSMPVGTQTVTSDQASTLRMTKVGAFIRRLSLDELPQFVNILRGEMAIVGPRPSLLSQTTLIEWRRDKGILGLRPGLTGLAQVKSYDGMPDSEKVMWEARYEAKVTFLRDMAIVLKTLAYLVKPPPTY
jgi:O-antigen biosynthesis protein WbqP